MLTIFLSSLLAFMPLTTPPLAEYVDQQYVAYDFDEQGYVPRCQKGTPMTPVERKKAILYCYFQVQKSKFSDSYMDLVDRIDEIIKYLSKTAPRYDEKLMSWDEFQREYKRQGVTVLPFVGYGNLVNKNELKRILPTERKMEAVIGFGGKSIFKFHSPTPLTCQLPAVGYEQETATLALEEQEGKETFDLKHLFNGVVFDLHASEAAALQKWEPNFQIKRVPIVKMKRFSKMPIRIDYAYALVNNEPSDKTLRPHLNYLNLVIDTFDDGDLEVQDFVRLFSETSYLGDGDTSIERWLEAEVKKYYQDDLIIQPIVQNHLKAIEGLS